MRSSVLPPAKWIPALITGGLLCACAVGPNFVKPTAPATDGYTPEAAGTRAGTDSGVRYVSADQVPVRWWNVFGVPALDQLVGEALKQSPTLASAQAMLRQSLDARRAGYGVFMPQVAVDASGTRERAAPLRLGSNAPSTVFNVFTLSGSVGYVLDVFGGERRRVEVLGAQVDEAREAARAAYLSVTANVVSTATARAAYSQEAAITRELIEDARTQMELANARYLAGSGSLADVAAFRTDMASLEASLPGYLQHEDQARHLLSVLCGHAPSEWQAPVVALGAYTLPADIPVVVPSRLAEQRPDIRAAEARLHQSSANIGVATADLFPTISLTATTGAASNELSQVGTAGGRFWSGTGDLSMPLMQGGTLWYTRRAAIEAYQASLQDYRGVVLQALDQVADALRALDHDNEAVAAAAEAQHAAELSIDLVQANYQAGVTDYLAVLTAHRALGVTRLAYAQAQAQQLQDVVALFVALGGDWSVTPTSIVEGAR